MFVRLSVQHFSLICDRLNVESFASETSNLAIHKLSLLLSSPLLEGDFTFSWLHCNGAHLGTVCEKVSVDSGCLGLAGIFLVLGCLPSSLHITLRDHVLEIKSAYITPLL